MHKTFFILKSDAYPKKDEVLEKIHELSPVISSLEFEMPPGLCSDLYSKLVTPKVLDALQEYLSENRCVAVTCQIPIDELVGLSGNHTDPQFCERGTIRREYGMGQGFTASGLPVIRNAIHRPKDTKQNSELLDLFKMYKLLL